MKENILNIQTKFGLALVLLLFLTGPVSWAQTIIKGKVLSDAGESLPGVSVVIKGTTNGTNTDVDGKYTISADPTAVLVFSYIGYLTEEVEVGDKSDINMTLFPDIKALGEVVVVGYGSMKKADLTGSVASINGEDIAKITSTNIGQAIQGRMAGVQVTQGSGQPGGGVSVQIRGVGSILSSNGPLVLINGFQGNLDDVDADNIESITVLKDAAAASIYGSRAANGVILVTTKRGEKGKMNIEFKSEVGIQSLTQSPDYLGAQDWARRQNEERINAGNDPYWVDELAPENLKESTDWSDFLFRKAVIQDHHLGVNGGNENTKYALGLGYVNQEGTIIGTKFDRYNVRLNIEHIIKDRVTLGVNLSALRSKYDYGIRIYDSGGRGALNLISGTSPTLPAYTNGKPTLPRYPGEQYMWSNNVSPALISDQLENRETINKSVANVFAEVKLIDGLKYKFVANGLLSNKLIKEWSNYWAVYNDSDPTKPALESGPATLRNMSDEDYLWEIQNLLTYDKTFGNHSVQLLAGISSQQSGSTVFDATASDFPNNEIQVLSAGINMISIGGNESQGSLYSQFGRLNYSFKDKYMVQANVRRDGSSVFAPGNQYGVFPSFSAGWRLSQEPFLSEVQFLDDLKIRAGYGTLGNAGIPSFAWISTFDVNGGYVLGVNQNVNAAYYIQSMTNENVKWETTATTDVGLDITMFSGRLAFVGDYYVKNTTDMLLRASIPPTSGYVNGPIVNLGEIENKGWEMMVSYRDQIGDLEYGASFNLSHNENKLIDMGNIEPYTENALRVQEGLPLFSYWGYIADGIWKSQTEIDENPSLSGARPGGLKYKDINGYNENGELTGTPDGMIDDADKTVIGSWIPKYNYGINLELGYKGFDLSMLLQGEEDKDMMIEAVFGGNGNGSNVDKYYYENRAILGEDGNVAGGGNLPALSAGPPSTQWSTFMVHDISYLRIKNIQFGYTFSENLIGKLGVNSLRLYLNLTNPFTWTGYRGYDPEMRGSLNDGLISRGGVDYYPMFKSTTFGLKVSF